MLWGLCDKIRITEAKYFERLNSCALSENRLQCASMFLSLDVWCELLPLDGIVCIICLIVEFDRWMLTSYMYLLVSVDKWDYVKLWWTWIQIGNRRYSRLFMLPFNSAFMLDILWCHFRAQIICSILLVQTSNDVTSWIPNSIVYYLLLTVFCALFIETFMLKH